MIFRRMPRIRPGARPYAAPHNAGFRALEDLQRAHVAGTLAVGAGGIYDDPPRRQKARLVSAVGGGKYTYKRVQGTSSGGYTDDASDTGNCWEDNLTTGLPANATAGTLSLVVELVWEGPASEWRFQKAKC